ncbi:serine--tRNA ligase [Nanoarchaeota archaeon]
MLDINFIRENPGMVRKSLEKRKDLEKIAWLDDLLKIDEKWRKLKQDVDNLRHERNKLSQEVNQLMKQGKKKDAALVIKKAKAIPAQIEAAEKKMLSLRMKIDNYLMRLPNILHDSVPFGKDDSDNKEIRVWGKKPKFDFKLKAHGELAEELGIADFKQASEVSGAGFHYMIGDLALLNNALAQFAIDFLVKKGFKLVIPPLALRRKPYEGVTDLADFENVMYKIEGEDLYLIATSEHPIGAYMMGKVLTEKDMPVAYVGYSPNFRKEIGSHGVDTKGLFRTHQFWKVEQFIFCKPEDSWEWIDKLVKNSEELFKALELPYRVVNICTGDIGSVAAKKYDVEAWMPRQNAYKEVVSCSNCTDYQARRLNIKYEAKDGTRKFVHTLNSTAIATSRALVAILENNQNKDGSINIPKVLQKYMGKKKIEAQ